MTIKEAAAMWQITERRVNELCKTGRISDAFKKDRKWYIPNDARKPKDQRYRQNVISHTDPSVHKPLPIGVSDYKEACTNYYYVDKTMLIKDFLDERPKVSLFTRPRRFGKTLNMDMLRTFLKKQMRIHPATSTTKKSGIVETPIAPIKESTPSFS